VGGDGRARGVGGAEAAVRHAHGATQGGVTKMAA
jgi:hypothetical protein